MHCGVEMKIVEKSDVVKKQLVVVLFKVYSNTKDFCRSIITDQVSGNV